VHPSALGTALVALGASLELTGPRGKRVVKAEEFFTLPAVAVDRENSLGADEILTLIVVPPPVSGSRSAYLEVGEKESFDWPIAEVAVVIERSGANVSRASIVLGAAAPVPYRAVAAEKALVGKPLDDASARAVAKVALDGATPLSLNGYKTTLFETVIRRTLLKAGGAK
jgi:xanthine dehydrogenase YagS FAD-binding subunit